MVVDVSRLEEFTRRKDQADAQRDHASTSGSGGPPHGPDMQARVAKLEDAFREISVTLGRLDVRLGQLASSADLERLRTELVNLAGRIDGKAGAADLAELKGKVGRIPTVPVLVGMLTIVVIVLRAWPWIALHVLP